MKVWNTAENPWTVGGREEYTLLSEVPDELLTFEEVCGYRIPLLESGNRCLAFDPFHGAVIGTKRYKAGVLDFLFENLSQGGMTSGEVEAQCLKHWEAAQARRIEVVSLERFLKALPGYLPDLCNYEDERCSFGEVSLGTKAAEGGPQGTTYTPDGTVCLYCSRADRRVGVYGNGAPQPLRPEWCPGREGIR